MKKTLISLFVIGIITLFTAGAYAKWVRYDNFDSYDNIDDMKASGKWFISPESEGRANFSIVDGRLRIQHFLNKPQASAWAQIIEESYKLKGIKVTIEVVSWDGDTRVRIGAESFFFK